MKIALIALPLVLIIGFLVFTGFRMGKPGTTKAIAAGSFYDLLINRIDGELINMAEYKDKYVLCVNVASNCGYTPQYKELEQLYQQFEGRLMVIGFPCNQFMNQEPGSPTEISSFCAKNYAITFPLTEKIHVKGKTQHPIYQWLCNQPLGTETSHEVKWNFHKFLVSPDGKLIGSFKSGINPLSEEITGLIKG